MRHSIVIPLYNKADYVCEALESLAAQTHPPAEIVLVDDRSTDGSLQKVRAFLDCTPSRFPYTTVKIVPLAQNAGPGHARNVGFAHSTGDIVGFLDADDFYHPQFCEQVHKAMQSRSIDFLVLGIRYVPGHETDPDLASLAGMTALLGDGLYLLPQPLRAVSAPGFVMGVGCNVVAKRRWMEPHAFETAVRLNENVDYWYRVLRHAVTEQVRVGLLTGGYLNVRMVPRSLSRTAYRHWKDIDFPPLLTRYRHSKNPYDKRMVAMIGKRWFFHALRQLGSPRQKLLFLLNYRTFWIRHGGYLLFGKE